MSWKIRCVAASLTSVACDFAHPCGSHECRSRTAVGPAAAHGSRGGRSRIILAGAGRSSRGLTKALRSNSSWSGPRRTSSTPSRGFENAPFTSTTSTGVLPPLRATTTQTAPRTRASGRTSSTPTSTQSRGSTTTSCRWSAPGTTFGPTIRVVLRRTLVSGPITPTAARRASTSHS